MIKLILLLLTAYCINLSAQSPEDMHNLINQKKYNQAYSESKKSIYNGADKDEFLYTNILAIAGKNFTGEFSEEKIENLNVEYEGMDIQLSEYSLSSGDCNTNCFRYLKDDPSEIYMVKTFLDSKSKPAIVLMVYVELKNHISKQEFDNLNNKKAIITGKIEKLYLSGNMYKRLNLRIYDAELSLKGN